MKRILKIIGLSLLALAALMGIIYAVLPKGPRDPMAFDDPWQHDRPMVEARDYVVATGTPWATQAAVDILERGGNAYDAAAAALLMLNVTHGEAASFPSIAPLMIYDAPTGQVRSYVGVGTAPQAATIDYFHAQGFETMPDLDIRAQLVPASPDVIISLLRDYGTMSFAEVSAHAIQMAREGFPAHEVMVHNMDLSLVERIGFCFLLMPYNCQVYLHGEWWRPFQHADRVTFPDLAKTLEALAQAEQQVIAAGGSREEGLQATRDYFYRGPLAEAIADYHAKHGGLIVASDLANYSGQWEEPLQAAYGEYTIYVNGTWTQGIVLPMALHNLEGIDLESMGHNSPEYIHTVVQAIELAQADRDAYVADPAFVDVPVDMLLSADYAASRQALMSDSAFAELPPPGSIPDYGGAITPTIATFGDQASQGLLSDFMHHKDTTQLAIIDLQGNAVVMTPSDFPKSPMIPGTGMTLGDRMTQFRLDPDDVDALEPGKRPRVTPNAVIVFRNGEFWMGFSTEGGDMQPQALLQVFLNMTLFGMDIQEAIDAPRFKTLSAPSSFSPHESYPAFIQLEADLYERSITDLLIRGYTLQKTEKWDLGFGKVGAVIRDVDHLYAGSDPRGETTAAGK